MPGVDPYLKDGVRWLNPAAFAAPMPGTFGNLPRNYLRGPAFWQADMMVTKDFRFAASQGVQLRLDVFNLAQPSELREPGGHPAGRYGRPGVHGRGWPGRSATCSVRSTARSASARLARRRSRFATCSERESGIGGQGSGDRSNSNRGRFPDPWISDLRSLILRLCNIRVTEPKSPPPMLLHGSDPVLIAFQDRTNR